MKDTGKGPPNKVSDDNDVRKAQPGDQSTKARPVKGVPQTASSPPPPVTGKGRAKAPKSA